MSGNGVERAKRRRVEDGSVALSLEQECGGDGLATKQLLSAMVGLQSEMRNMREETRSEMRNMREEMFSMNMEMSRMRGDHMNQMRILEEEINRTKSLCGAAFGVIGKH